MTEQVVLDAIRESTDAAKAMIEYVNNRPGQKKIAFPDKLLDELAALCTPAYTSALILSPADVAKLGGEPWDPRAVWKISASALIPKVQAMMALAISYAQIEKVDEVTVSHLKRALKAIGPDCEVRTKPVVIGGTPHRFDYCPDYP